MAEERIETPHFVFTTADGRAPMAHELAGTAERVLLRVSATLGLRLDKQKPIHVSIHHGDDAFAAALPHAGSMVEWASGIAIPSKSRIYLKIAPETRAGIHDVFVHEVSHVILKRAAGNQRIPRWFSEGIAVNQAGERILERWHKTTTADLTDSVMPLALLDAGFPPDAASVELAYAQSTSFVRYLIDLYGWNAIRIALSRMRAGTRFDVALQKAFARPLSQLEAEWRLVLDRQSSWIPWVTNDSLLWVFMSLLFILAWWVTRQRNRARLLAMDLEYPEEEEDDFA